MFQLKDDDKLMLLLEINKLIPLCHQLQTMTKTSLQNRVILKVRRGRGLGERLERSSHVSVRLAPASVLKGTESPFPARLRAAAVRGHHKVDFRLQTSS